MKDQATKRRVGRPPKDTTMPPESLDDQHGVDILWMRLDRIEAKLDTIISILGNRSIAQIQDLLKQVSK